MSTRGDSGAARNGAWSVVCDFDGTISLEDVTDSLLQRFARPGWRELEAAWDAGRIGSRACMAGQVALLDCSREELEAHVAGIALDPGFRAFVDAVRASDASLTIASDGLDVVITTLLERDGLTALPVRASRLVEAAPRQWTLEFPHARAACASGNATCKCACLGAGAAGPTLLVGDGASDFCAAAHADLTFAKSRLRDRCAELGLPHRAIDDFAGALRAWHHLQEDGGLVAGPAATEESA